LATLLSTKRKLYLFYSLLTHWLGFKRLNCVPTQMRMMLEHMLSKERFWVHLHNRACLNVLKSFLLDDKHAFECEAELGIGVAPAPGNTNKG
jgi:hypothetical protein